MNKLDNTERVELHIKGKCKASWDALALSMVAITPSELELFYPSCCPPPSLPYPPLCMQRAAKNPQLYAREFPKAASGIRTHERSQCHPNRSN